MSAATPLSDPKELAMQERAQALVSRGDVVGATRLMDEFLAAHDGDWGSWLYLAGLHARIGRVGPAVAAYQACARQLEGDGRYERARGALQQAMRLTPQDPTLAEEIARLESLAHGLREVPPPPPEPSVPPRRPVPRGPKTSKDITTAVVARRSPSAPMIPVTPLPVPSPVRLERAPERVDSEPKAPVAPVKTLRRSGTKVALAAPKRAPEPSAEQTYLVLPSVTASVTDPYLAIFDILDSEKQEERLRAPRPRSIRHDETTPMLPRRALRS